MMRDTWLSNPRAALQMLGSSVRRGLDSLRGWQHVEVEHSLEEIDDLPARLTQVYALIDQARIAAPKHPERAALLAVEAMRRSAGCPRPTRVAAEQVLRDTLGLLGGLPLAGHAGGTSALALSRDGRTLATGGHDGTVQIWDLTAADPRAAWKTLAGHAKEVNVLALSADGRMLASASDDTTVRVWDLTAQDPETNVRILHNHSGPVEQLLLNADGRIVVSVDDDRRLCIWRPAADASVTNVQMIRLPEPGRFPMCLSDDGRTLALVWPSSATVTIWDLYAERLSAPHRLLAYEHGVATLALSRDGRMLFSGDAEGTICRWAGPLDEVERPTHQWRAHLGEVRNLTLSGNSQTLASAGADGAVRLWNNSQPQPTLRKAFYGFSDSAYGLALSANGHVLITQGRGRDDSRNETLEYMTRVWDLHPSNEFPSGRALRGPGEGAFNMALSDDGGTLVGCDDRDIWLWRQPVIPVHPAARALIGHNSAPRTMTMSRDGHLLVSVGRDAAVILWDLTAPDPSTTARVLPDHKSPVHGVALSDDKRTLITCCNGIFIWHLTDLDASWAVQSLDLAPTKPVEIALSQDGKLLAASDRDGITRCWAIDRHDHPRLMWSDQNPPYQGTHPLGEHVICFALALSNDGGTLAAGCDDGTLRVYDLRQQDPAATVRILMGHTGWVMALKFSPDGRTLLSGCDDGTARVWDLAVPNPHATVRVLRGHRDVIRALALSADGRTLVTSGDDEMIACVWDLTASDPNTTVRVLRGLEYSLDHVALSADGRTLITAGGTGAAQVWDLTDPEPNATVRNLPCHPEGLSAVALSPDGRTAYTASGQFGDPSDRTILIWPLDSETLLRAAARTLSRNLSGFEWARAFPDEPYRRTFPDLPDGHSVQYLMVH